MSEVQASDKSEHIILHVTIDNKAYDMPEETVVITISADNPLLGVSALSKIGRSENYMNALMQKVIATYLADEDDDEWDEDEY